MSREIKFRVWDKENNCWYRPTYAAHAGRLEELLIGLDGMLNMRTMDSLIHESGDFPDRFSLMQYTGLKDKNSKEIYEGDILRADFGFVYSVEYYVVEFLDGSFWIKDIKDYSLNHMGQGRMSSFEIIGNIYENPELLQK